MNYRELVYRVVKTGYLFWDEYGDVAGRTTPAEKLYKTYIPVIQAKIDQMVEEGYLEIGTYYRLTEAGEKQCAKMP